MSELSTLARPYAEAVFKIAVESKSTSDWSEMLEFLSAVMQDKEMVAIVANPKVSQEQLASLIMDICQDQVKDQSANFVKLLVQNERLTLAPQISELFEAYKADHEGYVDVELTSAYALTKDEQKKFATTLKKQLGKDVKITTSNDKSLIGGFIAKAGDKVIDGSVKGQLQQLAKVI